MAVLAGLATALVLIGLLLGWYSMGRATDPPGRPRKAPMPGPMARLAHLPRRTKLLLAGGAIAGFAIAVTTGWVVAIVALPAAAAGIPALMAPSQDKARIAKLDALEAWTRALANTLSVGSMGLEGAVTATLASAPREIRPEVSRLVGRLRARWDAESALRAFADDVDDQTGDTIAAALIVVSQTRGAHGIPTILEGLASSVAEQVVSRNGVEADRAKPRSAARRLTAMSLAVLGLLSFTGDFVEPYGTPLGQLILSVLLTAYVLVLVWMRRMTHSQPPPRFIGSRLAAETAVRSGQGAS